MEKARTLLLVNGTKRYGSVYYVPATTKANIGDYVTVKESFKLPTGTKEKLEVRKVIGTATVETNSTYEKFIMKCVDIEEIPPIVGIVQEVNNRITHIDDNNNPI